MSECPFCGAQVPGGGEGLARHCAAAGHLGRVDDLPPVEFPDWYWCPCGFRGPVAPDGRYMTMAQHWSRYPDPDFWDGNELTLHLLEEGLGLER